MSSGADLNFEQAVEKFHVEYCLPDKPLYPYLFSWGPSVGRFHESDNSDTPQQTDPSILVILKSPLPREEEEEGEEEDNSARATEEEAEASVKRNKKKNKNVTQKKTEKKKQKQKKVNLPKSYYGIPVKVQMCSGDECEYHQ